MTTMFKSSAGGSRKRSPVPSAGGSHKRSPVPPVVHDWSMYSYHLSKYVCRRVIDRCIPKKKNRWRFGRPSARGQRHKPCRNRWGNRPSKRQQRGRGRGRLHSPLKPYDDDDDSYNSERYIESIEKYEEAVAKFNRRTGQCYDANWRDYDGYDVYGFNEDDDLRNRSGSRGAQCLEPDEIVTYEYYRQLVANFNRDTGQYYDDTGYDDEGYDVYGINEFGNNRQGGLVALCLTR